MYSPDKFQKILFISFEHIGDTLRFTPLLKTLRVAYPNAYIMALLPESQGEILKNVSFVDDILFFPHKKIRENVFESAPIANIVDRYSYQMIQMLRRMEFDLVINPFEKLGASIAGLVKPKMALGYVMAKWNEYKTFGENAAKFYYTMSRQNELRTLNPKNFSETALDILLDLGVPNKLFQRTPEFQVSLHDELEAKKLFDAAGIQPNDFVIGFQMGAQLKKERSWPGEKFAAIANRLCEEFPFVKILLLGSANEVKRLEDELVAHLKVPHIMMAGKTSLLVAGAVLKKLDAMVTVDTGPMHMAASFGVPIVALFGLSTCIPNEARPSGDKHIIFMAKQTCDIPVASVYQGISNLVKKFSVSNCLTKSS